jgi:nucleoside-diphosphate kinase
VGSALSADPVAPCAPCAEPYLDTLCPRPEHDGKPFFESLVEFITSGPLVAAVVEGPRAITAWRQLAGGTDPVEKATPGTIRGDFGLETQFNLVHGSDSVESATREIKLWFPGL